METERKIRKAIHSQMYCNDLTCQNYASFCMHILWFDISSIYCTEIPTFFWLFFILPCSRYCDDISTVFLHNRLENQVLDTYGGHLKVQKAIQKTSKDLMFFSVQMLCSWFCRRDMGHRHLCFWFCRLGNLQNHEQKKNRAKKMFHTDISIFLPTNGENKMQI